MNVQVRRGPPPEDGEFREQRQRWPFVVLLLVVTFLVLAGSATVWVQRRINPPGAVGPPVRVTVTKGMSTGQIGALLEREGVIASAGVFRYYARLTGIGPIEAGDYIVAKASDLSDVVKVLKAGASEALQRRLTIPEGLTLSEVSKLVGALPGRSAERFIELANNGTIRSRYQPASSTSLEGLILPETYFVGPGDDEARILAKLVDAFDQLATRLDLPAASARFGITPYQAVIVASLVEREAKVDEDRGKVARVIYNRLKVKMPLQIDATVLYALGRPKQSVTIKDTKVNSPYNTYNITGLPPGPIAGPGRKSLEAATSPTPGDWIYYVLTDPGGKMSFTADDREFKTLKQQCIAKGLCG